MRRAIVVLIVTAALTFGTTMSAQAGIVEWLKKMFVMGPCPMQCE